MGLRPHACWDCGFESRRRYGCLCCVLSRTGLFVGLFTRPEELYRMWCIWVRSRNFYSEGPLLMLSHGGKEGWDLGGSFKTWRLLIITPFPTLRHTHPPTPNRDRIPVGARFSALVQICPGAQPASCTMGTGHFLGVKRPGRGIDHPPPSSAEVKERVELRIYYPSEHSWPVLGWTLFPHRSRLRVVVMLLFEVWHEQNAFVCVWARVRACMYVCGAKKTVQSFWLLFHDVERSFSYKPTVTVWMYLVNTRYIWLTSIFIGYKFLYIICSYNVCRHRKILAFNNRVA